MSSVRIRVKAVPGASRDAIGGMLGDRLKVKVAAPPEGGKANKAIRDVLARSLGVRAGDVSLVSGQTHPEKVFEIRGIDRAEVINLLGDECVSD